jgi:hypothetical protein
MDASRQRTASVVENIANWLGSLEIGTSGPIRAGEIGPQRPEQASSDDIGRGRTICEYIEIMQILPGSSDNARLINASPVICNMTTP